tara:strand:- start:1168 stop:1533 length:366 start_codon:yes stop_codon:yes gene_type:complete
MAYGALAASEALASSRSLTSREKRRRKTKAKREREKEQNSSRRGRRGEPELPPIELPVQPPRKGQIPPIGRHPRRRARRATLLGLGAPGPQRLNTGSRPSRRDLNRILSIAAAQARTRRGR